MIQYKTQYNIKEFNIGNVSLSCIYIDSILQICCDCSRLKTQNLL